MESDPDNIEAHNGMAKSLDYTGDPQGALMAYNNSLNIQPNQPEVWLNIGNLYYTGCLLYTSPSPRDATLSRMPSSA